MKKILFAFIMLLSFSSMSYASFPVTEQLTEKSTEQSIVSEESPSLISAVRGGGPGMGIAALCCGIVGIFFMGWLLGPLAIIFGALGLKNDGRGMAITGLVLGCLVTLLWLILLLLVGAALGAAGAF